MTDQNIYYAQFGEDRGLHGLFGGKRDGLCVEVGANDGLHGSNSLFFERLGWDCILVEPNPELCDLMRGFRTARLYEVAASDREGTATLQIATGAEGAHAVSTLDLEAGMRTLRAHGFGNRPVDVPTRRLDDILAEAAGSRPIDFVTIDVEGHEMAVLSGFSLDRWRPRVIIMESNDAASGQAVSRHLREAGYVRFRRTGVNDWYAHRSDAALGSVTRRAMYYPSRVVARARLVASSLKMAMRRIPGVLSVWHLYQHVARRPRTGR